MSFQAIQARPVVSSTKGVIGPKTITAGTGTVSNTAGQLRVSCSVSTGFSNLKEGDFIYFAGSSIVRKVTGVYAGDDISIDRTISGGITTESWSYMENAGLPRIVRFSNSAGGAGVVQEVALAASTDMTFESTTWVGVEPIAYNASGTTFTITVGY